MENPFARVINRARPLGKYARKYIRAVEQNGERLVGRLESVGRLSRIHLDRCSPSLDDDFRQVSEAAADPPEKLLLLGTFYAIQFLHLNARCLERLAVDLTDSADRRRAYRVFLKRAEREFTGLVSSYVRGILQALQPPPARGSYLLCAVGTRGHQDDIDVLVIDDGGPMRPRIDRAFGRLTGEMLRHASALDHYIAARIGAEAICLSPEDLNRALDTGVQDFVVVTELLRAEPLAGSRVLYRRLHEEVVAPCLYRPGGDNRRHEYYLRGLLGEIRSLLLYPPPPGSVNPKDDALRLILGLSMALKTMERAAGSGTRDVLRVLRGRRPALRNLLARLEESHVFLETFRHLAHLLLAQEEGIEVEGPAARENLRHVAFAMGYRDTGPVQAADHLLVHYHEAVERARAAALPLMEEVARHLAGISRFSKWTRQGPHDEQSPDAAVEIAAGTKVFRGARFWDDLLEALAAPDGRLLGAFVESYERLPEERRRALAVEYADWGRNAPYALLTILTLLAQRRRAGTRPEAPNAAAELTGAFLDRLGTEAEDIRALSRVFRFYPALLNRFVLPLDRPQLERLRAALSVPIGNPEVAEARDRFHAFLSVHQDTSRYVRRVLARLTERHPAVLHGLTDDAALRTLALGQLAAAERHHSQELRKDLLGDYYDVEFLRLALATQRGTLSTVVRAEFSEMTETYLGRLFDSCLREVERDAGERLWQRDLVGIYLAGGHARRRPFDEDYDMLVVMDSERADQRALAEKALVRMNRQIARRGLVAQYRLAERLGRFVTGLDELVALLEGEEDDLFVDLHQILGSRPVVGGRVIEQALVDRVIRPLIFERASLFAERLVRELRERRAALPSQPEGTVHIKAMRGGLREIDLCIAAAAARLGVRTTAYDRLDAQARRDPAHHEDYEALRTADEFLVAVRSAYRVAVAAADVLEKEHLQAPAAILGYAAERGGEAGAGLFEDIARCAASSARAIDRLMEAAVAGGFTPVPGGPS